MSEKLRVHKSFNASLALLFTVASLLAFVPLPAQAGTLTTTFIRPARLATAQATSVRVVFRTATAAGTSVLIDFNGADTTTWTGSSGVVNGTQTIATGAQSSAGQCAGDGFTILPGAPTAAGAGSVITISGLTTLATSTTYCADLTSTSAITLPTAGEYHPTVTTKTGGSTNDSTTVAVRVLGAGADQVSVNATVNPTFNFSLSGSTDNFTTPLAVGATTNTSGITCRVATNGASGWVIWAKGTNESSGSAGKGALKSTVNNRTIPVTNSSSVGSASHTLSTANNNSEDYGLGVTTSSNGNLSSGSLTLDAAFDSNATTKIGVLSGGASAFFTPLAARSGVAGDTGGLSSSDSITFLERAMISQVTPAGTDYADIITVVAAGRF